MDQFTGRKIICIDSSSPVFNIIGVKNNLPLKAAAEMIEESVDINKFCPTPSRKQQWPRTLTG